jgi:hypothetical protein
MKPELIHLCLLRPLWLITISGGWGLESESDSAPAQLATESEPVSDFHSDSDSVQDSRPESGSEMAMDSDSASCSESLSTDSPLSFPSPRSPKS